MAFEEQRAWIMLGVALCTYLAYVAVILTRAGGAPLAETSYALTSLVSIACAVFASFALHIVAAVASPEDAARKDQRDREINRFGEHVGQSFVVLGGVAAFGMALVAVRPFWIANVVYLAFVLSSVDGSSVKIVAYRRGFHP